MKHPVKVCPVARALEPRHCPALSFLFSPMARELDAGEPPGGPRRSIQIEIAGFQIRRFAT